LSSYQLLSYSGNPLHPFYANGRFITASTTAHHLSLLNHMNPIQAVILYFFKTKKIQQVQFTTVPLKTLT
jgi:hypothetical protein